MTDLPESRRATLAPFGRRVVAIFIDWAMCNIVAIGFLHYQFGGNGTDGLIPLAVFAVENVVLVGTLGFTVGHRVLGLHVVRLDGSPAGLVAALIRTVLLCLAVPALIWGRDGRGLHDRAAQTVILHRTRLPVTQS